MKPKTAAEILALPEFSVSYRRVVFHCSKCSEKNTIDIPTPLNVRAHFVEPEDVLLATDSDGVAWSPIDTDEGWMRRRIGA